MCNCISGKKCGLTYGVMVAQLVLVQLVGVQVLVGQPSFKEGNMILTRASAKLEGDVDGMEILKALERAGRTCYKSEHKITDDSAKKFVAGVIRKGHESVIEHEKLTARFICDRGVTHEKVRHRIASFSQESTRYCNYKGGVEFIIPCWMEGVEPGEYEQGVDHALGELSSGADRWFKSCMHDEAEYIALLTEDGWTPQQARSVLPNSLKTEIIMTANLREWRHFFKLRAEGVAGKPHPQMIEVASLLLEEAKEKVPVVFDDIC